MTKLVNYAIKMKAEPLFHIIQKLSPGGSRLNISDAKIF